MDRIHLTALNCFEFTSPNKYLNDGVIKNDRYGDSLFVSQVFQGNCHGKI